MKRMKKYRKSTDVFTYYINDVNKFELLSKEQEVILAKRIKKGNKRVKQTARATMANSNLRLVINLAKKYAHFGYALEDLVAAGNVGLLKAIDKYDHTKKFRFSTYATWWILQTIRKHLSDDTRMIRIPSYVLMSDNAIDVKNRTFVHSIDNTRKNEHGGDVNINSILAGDADVVDDVSNTDEINNMLRSVTKLDDRQQFIIRGRYGLGCQEKTLRQLGCELGISRERVRQIEIETMEMLRGMVTC